MKRALAIFALMVLAALPARAQVLCASRDDLVQHLAKTYEEAQVAVGLAADGKLFELFASTEGSWTMITTTPGGLSCIRAWGEGWRSWPDGDLASRPVS